MEFTRLADVDVVETANDTDKVLIEQNGEIKRVPKTEVGGSGGNTLALNMALDPDTGDLSLVSSNLTLDEALTAMSNDELTGGLCIFDVAGMVKMFTPMLMFADYTAQAGFACIAVTANTLDGEVSFMWTADGIAEM